MVHPGWLRTESPFHAGELAIQAHLGVQDHANRQGRRLIRESLIPWHQKFFARLSYLIVGTLDKSGYPWASILVGEPGFITSFSDCDRKSPDSSSFGHRIQVMAKPLMGDSLAHNLALGIDIGLLGIELGKRRRNRLNGSISAIASNGFEVTVSQSFGNCPQYIQARKFEWVETSSESSHEIIEVHSFGSIERNLITNADTFFIATSYQEESAGIAGGVDVSHKGGKPGFVLINNDQTITIPDFSGNNRFNTIGNILLNPPTGLLFIDFEQGDLLYLTGTAEIIWSEAEVSIYSGAKQLIRFHLEQGYLVRASLPLRWSNPEFSFFLEQTGSW